MEFEISNKYETKMEVDKSIFVSYLLPVFTKQGFIDILKNIKQDNPKAKHFCYAYKINNEIKFSDDGEPQGSAGKPLLSLLENKKLNNTALVVVRFFGGILLGSGRLLRTYVESGNRVINLAKLEEIVEEKEYLVEVNIESFELFKNYLLKEHFYIKSINFNDKIEMVFYAPLTYANDIESLFYNKIKIEAIKIVKHKKGV
jgi:Uncharacterized conserved protein